MEYLKIRKIFFWRNNSGAYVTERNHFLRFGEPGSPDIFAIHNGSIYGLEVKTPKGKPSLLQSLWSESFTTAGGHYYLVRSIDDVIKIFP